MSSTKLTPRRALASALAASVLVAGSALGLAAPAQAHNYLVSSTPEVGSTVTELPDRFSVTTNAPLLDIAGDGSGFALRIVDSDGLYYGDGCTEIEGSSLYSTAALGAPGEYTLVWQIVSEDGHTVSDEFTFSWQPAGTVTPSSGSATPPNCGGAAEAPVDEPELPVTPPAARADAALGDVLWAGGAILAILLAAGVTFFVLTRKRKA